MAVDCVRHHEKIKPVYIVSLYRRLMYVRVRAMDWLGDIIDQFLINIVSSAAFVYTGRKWLVGVVVFYQHFYKKNKGPLKTIEWSQKKTNNQLNISNVMISHLNNTSSFDLCTGVNGWTCNLPPEIVQICKLVSYEI